MTNQELGSNIRKIRELKGFSQQNLAIELDVDQKTISRIENGESSPKFETIVQISKALSISINQLLFFSEDQILNNYTLSQQEGGFISKNNETKEVEQLYKELLKEKDRIIALLENKG